MNLRATRMFLIGALSLSTLVILAANSASHVSAELIKGKLSSTQSKPGDMVAIKLKEDVRSNGEVVLKKGTTIPGVVRNVAPSMIDVEWLVPPVQTRSAQSVSFALQSVIQTNLLAQKQNDAFRDDEIGLAGSAPASSALPRPARGGSGLLAAASGRSNVALLSMPSVVALDSQSSSAIESSLGTSTSGQLFRVGHGELISAGGTKQSVDLYSHLSNDTVITSPEKSFEISSGAQLQMLVGVNRN